jgi:hypothetical protein
MRVTLLGSATLEGQAIGQRVNADDRGPARVGAPHDE